MKLELYKSIGKVVHEDCEDSPLSVMEFNGNMETKFNPFSMKIEYKCSECDEIGNYYLMEFTEKY